MAQREPTRLEEVMLALERAITLAARCRYGELEDQAREIERRAEALERLKESLKGQTPVPENVRADCRRLKQTARALSEVLRHATLVHAGLAQAGKSVKSGYTREGRFSSGETLLSADRSLFDEEA